MEADVWICQFWGVIFQKRIFLNSVIEWIEAQFGVITGFEAMWKQNSFFNIFRVIQIWREVETAIMIFVIIRYLRICSFCQEE